MTTSVRSGIWTTCKEESSGQLLEVLPSEFTISREICWITEWLATVTLMVMTALLNHIRSTEGFWGFKVIFRATMILILCKHLLQEQICPYEIALLSTSGEAVLHAGNSSDEDSEKYPICLHTFSTREVRLPKT